jgi:5-methylcytosine-specific restriction endonuclease McrA
MGTRSLAYERVLESRRWRDLKWRRIRHARFRCEGTCGYEYRGRFARGALRVFELHHVTYARLGREELSDVRVLCSTCHAVEHNLVPREAARPLRRSSAGAVRRP